MYVYVFSTRSYFTDNHTQQTRRDLEIPGKSPPIHVVFAEKSTAAPVGK